MKGFSAFDLDKIAELAQLSLTAGEREEFARQLEQILAYVGCLRSVDTDKVELVDQTSTPSSTSREDVPKSSLARQEVLRNAPEVEGGLIRVPRVRR
jgi:aspartyl-tRNA(Asn)/glutamyl-tRNA(Gln) amidotransferase subunit C